MKDGWKHVMITHPSSFSALGPLDVAHGVLHEVAQWYLSLRLGCWWVFSIDEAWVE